MTRNVTGGRTASRGRRAALGAVGGALVAVGLRRRSLAGAALALAGGWLLYRGLGGGSASRSASPPATGDATDAEPPRSRTEIEKSATVGKSADELYELWRDPETLTRIAGNVAEVGPAGADRYRWSVAGPLGRRLEWETEIVENRPGEVLRWESTEGAAISTEGSVSFRPAPADRGTEVTLALRFDPPGGRVGRAAMGLLGVVPETLASKLLYRFKSLAEAGEIPTLERNPSARGRGDWV